MSDRWLFLAPVVALAGCISSASTPCGHDLVCAPDLVCFHVTDPEEDRCVDPVQIRACEGVPAGMACPLDGVSDAGRCYDGVCLPGGCGNGRVDAIDGEVCDDANAITGDGCSASCTSNETCGNGVVDPLLASGPGEQCDDGALFSFDGCGHDCRPEAPRWTKIVATRVPDPRDDAAMAYDAGRGQVVLFGGASKNSVAQFDDTWTYDGHGWRELAPSFSPPGRNGHALAYDAKRARVVLFGGRANSLSTGFDDTWLWDGTTWIQAPHAAAGPVPRVYPTMAYDSARDVVVMFGGTLPGDLVNVELGDTWEWDGATWIERMPSSRPPTQTGHAMTYDPSRGVIVLVGREVANPLAVVWEFDGSTWVRKARTPAPPARDFASIGYDSTHRTIVYAGGIAGATLGDAWSWDGQTWSSVVPLVARAHAASASDPIHGEIVLEGGTPEPPTTTWDGAKWSKLLVPAVGERVTAAIAYDSIRGRLVVVGGADGPATLADTLVLDSSLTWSSGPTLSTPRTGAAMAFDPVRREILLFGGNDGMTVRGDTWSWDGDPMHSWMPRPGGPPARTGARMAFDQARGRVVLFGGTPGLFATAALNDTWEWDGTSWSLRAPVTKPPGRTEYALAYDPIRSVIVMFSGRDGSTTLDDLWAWDGSTWVALPSPPTRPTARGSASMAWNPARGRLLLFGGQTASTYFNDTWEWDGTRWSTVFGFDTPGRRAGAAMASAPDGSGVIMFGGGTLAAPLEQLWQLRWDATGPHEACTGYSDLDGDGLRGCADPDCWPACSPVCSPGVSCAATAPRCGDGTCDPRETCRTCAADCGACVPICGDLVLDPGEACPGDVP